MNHAHAEADLILVSRWRVDFVMRFVRSLAPIATRGLETTTDVLYGVTLPIAPSNERSLPP